MILIKIIVGSLLWFALIISFYEMWVIEMVFGYQVLVFDAGSEAPVILDTIVMLWVFFSLIAAIWLMIARAKRFSKKVFRP